MSEIIRRAFGSCVLELVTGDLTEEDTDAVVNAANSSLLGGGGVDGAIHRTGGPEILAECRRLRATAWPEGLPPGEAVVTGAGRLPCRFVIHTVGPVWQGGRHDEGETLARCYLSSLARAQERGLTSVAFPSISTGAYGYPVHLAAGIALAAIRDAIQPASSLRLVRLVLWSDTDRLIYARALDGL